MKFIGRYDTLVLVITIYLCRQPFEAQEVQMEVFRIIIQVIFIILCIALTVLVLMQEGKSAGLGAISGAAETYWGKNKGRSMEGKLVKFTKYLAIGFMVLAVILNLNVF